MKYFNFKWLFAVAFLTILFSACDKASVVEPIGGASKIIKFINYGGIVGTGFDNTNLAFDPSLTEATIELQLEYSTNQVSNQDISVVVEFDAAALAAYNAMPGNPQYQKLPDSAYSFPSTTVLIKAGQTVSESFFVTVYPDKIDASINYMLPLRIASISGAPADVKIAPGTGVAYFHFIGNPLAGSYLWDFQRWNLAAQSNGEPTTPPNGGNFVNEPTTFSAVNSNTFTVRSGYFIQPRYLVTFTNDNGVFSNFNLTFEATDLKALIDAGISFINEPTIEIADPATGHYRFSYQVFNGTAYRYITDEYHK